MIITRWLALLAAAAQSAWVVHRMITGAPLAL
jgi:hypothetical protein